MEMTYCRKIAFLAILLSFVCSLCYPSARCSAAIVEIEYFFNDPDVPEGEGFFAPSQDGAYDENIEEINITGISLYGKNIHRGENVVYIRPKLDNRTPSNPDDDFWGEPITQTFSVTCPISVTTSNEPAELTNSNTISVTVSGFDIDAYSYYLDTGGFNTNNPISVDQPIALNGLTEGEHTLYIIGRDGLGSWQSEANAAMVIWTIDTTAPAQGTAVLSGVPEGTVNTISATIGVSGAGFTHYRYKLNDDLFTSEFNVSTNPQFTLLGLTEGVQTLKVIVRDEAGNWQTEANATIGTWTVDLTAPAQGAAVLSGVPEGTVNTTSTTIGVSGTGVTHYRYKLNNGSFTSEFNVSTNPQFTLSGLTEGVQTLKVIARDAAGNWQTEANATIGTWTVDLTAPAQGAAVLSGVPEGTVNTTSTTIGVSGTGVTHYRYKLNNSPFSSTFDISTTPQFTLSGLTEGVQVLKVIARDAAGNWQTEANATIVNWMVDTIPPVALLAGGLPQEGAVVANDTFNVIIGGQGVTHYRYELDNEGFTTTEKEVSEPISLVLNDGTHTIRVIGRDAAGNWQSQPSAQSRSWTVLTSSPVAEISGIPSSTAETTIIATVGGVNIASYKYALDNRADLLTAQEYAVETPITLADLTTGEHTLYVVGRNAAGVWQSGSTATTVTWIVTYVSVDPTENQCSETINIRALLSE